MFTGGKFRGSKIPRFGGFSGDTFAGG